MRIGVFGGTFDPVHYGHLILAEQAREQGLLDQVRFVPAARPPHKSGHAVSAFHQRVEMLKLAVAGNAAFAVDELESERLGPSYTADTLGSLQQALPGAQLCLLMGSDTLRDIHTWHEPDRVAALSEFLVVERVSTSERTDDVRLPRGARVRPIVSPLIEISSQDIRERAAQGRSLKYLIPAAVESYIRTHRLYIHSPSTS